MSNYDTNKIISVRTRAFGGRLENVRAKVDSDGTVRVYDSVAGHYTTCHSMPVTTIRRVRGQALA